MRPLRSIALLVPVLIAVTAKDARADVGDQEAQYTPDPSTRREGFTMGVHAGLAYGAAVGYPNEVAKLDQPEFEADTGLAAGPGGALWIGATLRDWFTFGIGLGHASIQGESLTSSGTFFLAHIEGFPLFYQDPFFEDVGVFAEFGAGGRDVLDGSDAVGEGGVMSFVGGGVFWEPLRLGQFSLGPALEVTHMWSQSMTSTIGLAGLRAAFYGGS